MPECGVWGWMCRAYLINGTGYAWAWHKRAKLEFSERTKMLPFESDENDGDFKPTGSERKKHFEINNLQK